MGGPALSKTRLQSAESEGTRLMKGTKENKGTETGKKGGRGKECQHYLLTYSTEQIPS